MRASQPRRQLVEAVLQRLPVLEGESVRVEFRPALTASRGQLYSHSMSGEPVHAGTHIRKRHIILDEWLAEHPRELRRILTHEVFHFAWARLGNVRRNEFTNLLRSEFVLRARGELGWSAEYRKLALIELGISKRRPRGAIESTRWRDYVCESFCDTAAWIYSGIHNHDEFTLGVRYRDRRKRWFVEAFGDGAISI